MYDLFFYEKILQNLTTQSTKFRENLIGGEVDAEIQNILDQEV